MDDTDADAVTVMTLADIVGVTVAVVVFVTVTVDTTVVRNRVVVLMEVLVMTTTPGQFLGLTHPPGQTWLSAIRHRRGAGLIEQTGRVVVVWACTIIVMAASSAAIMNLICSSKSGVEDQQNAKNLTCCCILSNVLSCFRWTSRYCVVLAGLINLGTMSASLYAISLARLSTIAQSPRFHWTV